MLNKRQRKGYMMYNAIDVESQNNVNESVVIEIRLVVPSGEWRRGIAAKWPQGTFQGEENVLQLDWRQLPEIMELLKPYT